MLVGPEMEIQPWIGKACEVEKGGSRAMVNGGSTVMSTWEEIMG